MSKMKEQQDQPVCEKCGKKLIPAFARFDGDPTFVGCLPHLCEPVKTEEKDKAARREMSLEGQLLEKDFEIQRLNGLIKKAYYAGVADEQSDEGTFNDFERQNNL